MVSTTSTTATTKAATATADATATTNNSTNMTTSLTQIIVKLDNAKSHLLSFQVPLFEIQEHHILYKLASAVNLPLHMLHIRNYNANANHNHNHNHNHSTHQIFLSAYTHLPILGGKGGFGTLLKGLSKQAGAKQTTDFGACRDLNGRRLRHVNDELKLQKWRQAVLRRNKLKKGGDANANGDSNAFIDIEQEFQDMQTESGIRNWHLMVPSWGAGEISQKSKRKEEIKIKRELREWANRENEKVKQKLILKRQREQLKVDYAAVGLEKGKEEDDKLTISIMEGLKKRRKLVNGNGNDEREMLPLENARQSDGDSNYGTTVSFLCTLSGDLVVEDNIDSSSTSTSTSTDNQHTSAMTMIQSKSEFATAGIIANAEMFNSAYSDYNGLYYEVTIETGGIAQIGWATSASAHNTGNNGFLPNSDTGDGVGDDKFSYGYDGLRGKVFHDGKELDYGHGSGSDSSGWKKGDVVGCLYDFTNGAISFSVNGENYGKAFDVKPEGEKGDCEDENGSEKEVLLLYPSLSLNENEIVGINIGPTFRHCPNNGNAKKTKTKKTKGKKVKKEHQYLAISSIVVNQNDGKCSEEDDLEELNVKQRGSETGGEDAIIGSMLLPEMKNTIANADTSVGTSGTGTAAIDDTTAKTTNSNEPIDLEKYMAAQELEVLGMNRLKEELYRLGCKCGGSLSERASRLYSLKSLPRDQIPPKLRGKNFHEAVP